MNNDIIELTAKEVLRHLDINLNQARQLIDAVMKKADEMGVKAVCAVANSAGRPVAVECMDGAYIASYDVALNKSFTVTALKNVHYRPKAAGSAGRVPLRYSVYQ